MSAAPEDARPVRRIDDLIEPFHAAEKASDQLRIGVESEKFGVHADGVPLAYAGEAGVEGIFAELRERGWQEEREYEGGPVVALRRDEQAITLEPGAQFELSGAPLADVHATHAELIAHLEELAPIAARRGILWLGVGFHPLARQADLPWVPKQRYAIMREYLPPLGAGAPDMMRRTATVQANFDYTSEEDALRKLRVSLLLAPLANAMLANSPFLERGRAAQKSLRGHVWLRMDPARSGLIDAVLAAERPRYRDYVEWALDAGMFLFKRGERMFPNTGQTFRSFLADGFGGERATLADWKLHLGTLFPEGRLKNTLEVRCCDAQSLETFSAIAALFTGLFYDARALAEVEALLAELGAAAIASARLALVTRALDADVGGRPARALAERVLDSAGGGLDRRARSDARGRSERMHLAALERLVGRGATPADRLLAGLPERGPYSVAELVRRTRIDANAESAPSA